MINFAGMKGGFVNTGDDYIMEFDELLNATVEYFENGGSDWNLLLSTLSIRHEELIKESGCSPDPFRKAHREHYMKEGFYEAFGFTPN